MAEPLLPQDQLKKYLDREVERYNTPDFIISDPIQFPRRFSSKPDIEIATLLCSSIAWGNRKMICRDCDSMLALMENQPYRFVMEQAYEDLPDRNIHRTFFTRDLRHFLRGLHRIYSSHATLDDFAHNRSVGSSETPSWLLAEMINAELNAANGCNNSRCLPCDLRTTALKRLNMGLRWLVRNDGIVDIGIWQSITPSQLFIPLDVHVGNAARALGITSRRANDRRTAIEITDCLRRLNPDDPIIYDFALFDISLNKTLDS